MCKSKFPRVPAKMRRQNFGPQPTRERGILSGEEFCDRIPNRQQAGLGSSYRALPGVYFGRAQACRRSRSHGKDAAERQPRHHGVGWRSAGGHLAVADGFRVCHLPFGPGGEGVAPAAGNRQRVGAANERRNPEAQPSFCYRRRKLWITIRTSASRTTRRPGSYAERMRDYFGDDQTEALRRSSTGSSPTSGFRARHCIRARP